MLSGGLNLDCLWISLVCVWTAEEPLVCSLMENVNVALFLSCLFCLHVSHLVFYIFRCQSFTLHSVHLGFLFFFWYITKKQESTLYECTEFCWLSSTSKRSIRVLELKAEFVLTYYLHECFLTSLANILVKNGKGSLWQLDIIWFAHVIDRIYIFQNITHIVAFNPRLKSNKMQCIAAVNVSKKLTKS